MDKTADFNLLVVRTLLAISWEMQDRLGIIGNERGFYAIEDDGGSITISKALARDIGKACSYTAMHIFSADCGRPDTTAELVALNFWMPNGLINDGKITLNPSSYADTETV